MSVEDDVSISPPQQRPPTSITTARSPSLEKAAAEVRERREAPQSQSASVPSSSSAPQRTIGEFAREGGEVLRDAVNLALTTGLRPGIFRTIQASTAAAATAVEFAQDVINQMPSSSSAASASTTARPADTSRGAAEAILSSQALSVALASTPKALRKLFERLGATYVKLGQFIASSPSLFPAEYVLEFQKCLDQTPPTGWADISRTIQAELGRPMNEVFESVNPTPLASASIAQVHSARLRTGEEVVIKVQKPEVESILKADLAFVLISTRVLQWLNPELTRISLAEGARNIRDSMLEELDFVKEADNIEQFSAFLSRSGLDDMATVPKVFRRFSSRKVLVMERLRGVPFSDVDAVRRITDNPEQALINAINTWSLSLVMNDFFHADVHAGNLLLLDDGRVGFIDFGIVGRISKSTWRSVQKLTACAAMQDYKGMASALVSMGAASRQVDVDQFGLQLKELIEGFESISATLEIKEAVDMSSSTAARSVNVHVDEDEVTRLLVSLVKVADENGLRLPSEFILLLKQALYFNRYSRLIAPELDYLRDDRMKLQDFL
ncbi:unnamed protein product [Vitrella brassicaformis CCMP3155]|uniref:Protein kinase domain-containing protein n=1 Tax=Vitrella brassicaformis (strain CCMP3155) TaxID=1169540 RepID=A0A0G4EXX4_VITBC|nr:unnamed protein product [Vitrella brassicaformis CCMP3155]|eukprot:CEM03260.1 unnamed protein product [Vitrella brassicaformis CCMP3155]